MPRASTSGTFSRRALLWCGISSGPGPAQGEWPDPPPWPPPPARSRPAHGALWVWESRKGACCYSMPVSTHGPQKLFAEAALCPINCRPPRGDRLQEEWLGLATSSPGPGSPHSRDQVAQGLALGPVSISGKPRGTWAMPAHEETVASLADRITASGRRGHSRPCPRCLRSDRGQQLCGWGGHSALWNQHRPNSDTHRVFVLGSHWVPSHVPVSTHVTLSSSAPCV